MKFEKVNSLEKKTIYELPLGIHIGFRLYALSDTCWNKM